MTMWSQSTMLASPVLLTRSYANWLIQFTLREQRWVFSSQSSFKHLFIANDWYRVGFVNMARSKNSRKFSAKDGPGFSLFCCIVIVKVVLPNAPSGHDVILATVDDVRQHP
jgi:hypothetical protein